MRLNEILSNWRLGLTDGEFVTNSSLEILEKRLKNAYHLIPFGTIGVQPSPESTLPELSYSRILDYHGFGTNE